MLKSISEFWLTNYKKHKELAAKVGGNSFILQGVNGAGKSSVLQAIDDLLQTNGHLDAEVQEANPDELLTVGEEDGEAGAVLTTKDGAEVRVTRKFTKKGLGRYELRVKEGERWQPKMAPQQVFRELFGNVLDLSPLIDMSGPEQVDFIKSILMADAEVKQAIDEAAALEKKLRDERVLVGRKVKDLQARFNVPEYRALFVYENEEPVDVAAIEAKLVDVADIRNQIGLAVNANDMADQYIHVLSTVKVKDLEIKGHIDAAVKLLCDKKVDTTALTEKLQNNVVHNIAVKEEIGAANIRNANIERAKALTADRKELADAEAEYAAYTEQIKTVLDSIAQYTTSVPVGDYYPELELVYETDADGKPTREGLFLRGLPFNRRQQSYGEMVYVMLCMSKKLNPNGLQFVKIGDWNLLDVENQQRILDLAKREDIQLGIEKVDENREIEIKIIEK